MLGVYLADIYKYTVTAGRLYWLCKGVVKQTCLWAVTEKLTFPTSVLKCVACVARRRTDGAAEPSLRRAVMGLRAAEQRADRHLPPMPLPPVRSRRERQEIFQASSDILETSKKRMFSREVSLHTWYKGNFALDGPFMFFLFPLAINSSKRKDFRTLFREAAISFQDFLGVMLASMFTFISSFEQQKILMERWITLLAHWRRHGDVSLSLPGGNDGRPYQHLRGRAEAARGPVSWRSRGPHAGPRHRSGRSVG